MNGALALTITTAMSMRRSLTDPFEHKSSAGLWLILVVIVVAVWVFWRQGLLAAWL